MTAKTPQPTDNDQEEAPAQPAPEAAADTVASKPCPRWGAWLGVAAGVFGVCCAILFYHAAPGVSFHDSGEFDMVAYSTGIGHPPGAPAWALLASGFVRLGRFADAARGANLFSACCGALTLALLSLLAQMWVWLLAVPTGGGSARVAGLAAPLVLLHSPAFLEQSFIAEQYTLLAALLGLVLLPATLLHPRFASPPSRRVWLCLFAGLFSGLAIGNHPSQIILGAFLCAVVWEAARGGRRNLAVVGRLAGGALAGLLLGLLVFLWVPLRSHANPLMDWGNVKTLDRFLWAVGREQWASRPLSEAPPGFVREWLASYQFAANFGLAGAALALSGMAVLAHRGRKLLLWLAAIVIPYAAGMLLGHLHQAGISLDYIHSYGVMDWHLPLYQAGALLAGVGAGVLAGRITRVKSRLGIGLSRAGFSILVLFLAATATRQIAAASLRHFTAPTEFVNALLAPLPPDAIALLHRDNCVNMLAYQGYCSGTPSSRFIAYSTFDIANLRQGGVAPAGPPWSAERKAWFVNLALEPDNQPLRLKTPGAEQMARRPLFIDSGMNNPELCRYMVPAGLLYEIRDTPVSNEDALAADGRWRQRWPEALKRPNPKGHRLERTAWAALLAGRGVYFTNRGLWSQAAEAYALSLGWFEASAPVEFSYGYVLEMMDRAGDAEKAYRVALELDPALGDARLNLANLLARSGRQAQALALLEEGVRRNPHDNEMRQRRNLVRGMMGRSS